MFDGLGSGVMVYGFGSGLHSTMNCLAVDKGLIKVMGSRSLGCCFLLRWSGCD